MRQAPVELARGVEATRGPGPDHLRWRRPRRWRGCNWTYDPSRSTVEPSSEAIRASQVLGKGNDGQRLARCLARGHGRSLLHVRAGPRQRPNHDSIGPDRQLWAGGAAVRHHRQRRQRPAVHRRAGGPHPHLGRRLRCGQRPFLDLAGRVLAGGERGLLGLAFHPQFAANRRFFVNYTRRPDGATVVAEFRASDDRQRRPPGRAQAPHRPAALRQPQWRHARLRPGRPPLHRPRRRRRRGRPGRTGRRTRTRCSARSCASTSTAASPTRSRPTTRSRAAAAGPRSSRSASATPGGSRSTGSPASSMSAMSARARSRRSTSSRRGGNYGWRAHGGQPLLRAGHRLQRSRT